MNESDLLEITLDDQKLQALFPLFQKGVRVKIETGCSIKDILCGQWGIDPEYVEGRISTLFLNAMPVDDMEAAVVRDGDTLALSSAMPGLVGAVMRRSGFFASLRHSISYRGEAAIPEHRAGFITLKLFNLLMAELGPLIARQGFWADARDLGPLLALPALKQTEDFQRIFVRAGGGHNKGLDRS